MKVLLVVSDTHQHSLQNIGRGVPGLEIKHYIGPDNLTAFLGEHGDEYDAVATTDYPAYNGLLPSLMVHPGPRIILQLSGTESIPEGFRGIYHPITDGLRRLVSESQ
ncbi:MAG: hypothetical protein GF368_05000 [Candidatus Aenigmarchaeota archaeon]|nr:hypothetical protein [Candidatus Aenigmarchaeota archaeon]